MFLQKLLIVLMIVSASKKNKDRRKPYDRQNNNQVVKKEEILEGEKTLDVNFKKLKNDHLSSFDHSISSCLDFENEECLERFDILFKNLLFNTLRLLDSTYRLYGKRTIRLDKCFKLKNVTSIEKKIEKYIGDLENNHRILLNRFSKINSLIMVYFLNKKVELSDSNIENYIDTVYFDLFDELKNENNNSHLNSVLIAAKDFGPDRYFGFVSLVLFMFSPDIVGKKKEFKEFLIYSIIFYRCLILKRSQTNEEIKFIHPWDLKGKLYKMALKCFFPLSYEIEYKKIFQLLYNYYDQNKWYYEPQVLLLLYLMNNGSIPEFYYIYGNLNAAENITDMPTKKLADEFYVDMEMLYKIERIVMKKSEIFVIKD